VEGVAIIKKMNDPSKPPTAESYTPPELLAPAGDWQCVRAAIENGADAIYFGLDIGFNARARAANFPLEDLPRLMATLHRRGLKGYTTVNTLAFTSELPQLERVIREIAAAGVDAVLVQDVGAARLIRAVCPDLPLHASTQMTLTSAESIALAESLGIERVVLARELSVDEIVKIRQQTTMPLEVFVHGALCVAYSGQCLTSESLGGRSANRGQCAQACRLPYDLVCDGRDIDLGEQKYLLSPQDLAAYALAPELIEAGVCSFKIEGRLKTPEYVANITRHYRQAIDNAIAGRPVEFTPRDVEEMELSFSRGFSHGWLQGCDHKALVPAKSSSKRGVYLGKVVDVRRGRVVVDLAGSVKRGDGVSFDCGRAVDDEQGGRVYEVFQSGRSLTEPVSVGRVELAFGHNAVDLAEIAPGQLVWKTDDPELTARLRKTFTSADPQRRMPVDLHVQAAVGQPLRIAATTANGATCELATEEVAVEAKQHALSVETLEKQLGRLGGTPFELRHVEAKFAGRPMVPFSVLGKLRHELVRRLEEAVVALPSRRIATGDVLADLRASIRGAGVSPAVSTVLAGETLAPRLHILCRSLKQLSVVLELGERSLYADFADIREYREAVALSHERGAVIYLATPRIQKPGEIGIFQLLAKQQPDGVLVRNFGGLEFFAERDIPLVGDFSLNVTNELTADYYRQRGLPRVTASYDLNREQLLDLVDAVPPTWLEVVVHQHMPMFHMEHCVFCSVLSPGTNKTNCGRPCDSHEVKLRDRIGMEHVLTADVGCRNTLFNATPQSAAEVVPQLRERGVQNYRIELLSESPTEIKAVLGLYRQLLSGDISGKEVWTQLRASNRVGVTRGTLEERRNPLAIL
jgi:putative protease